MIPLQPRMGDAGLSVGERVSLAGDLESLRYPDFCPACERPASLPVEIARVFAETEDADETVWRYTVERAWPLFCAPCAMRHDAERQGATAWNHFASTMSLAHLVPAAFLFYGGFGAFRAGIVDRSGSWLLVGAALAGVSALILLLGWRRGAWKRVSPPTSVTATFDFGADLTTPFHTAARTYVFASAGYAAAFERANSARHHDLTGPRQRSIEIARLIVASAIALGIVLFGATILALAR